MILLEVTTQNGNTIIANVVNQKIRSISANGNTTDWHDYKELRHGKPGQSLVVEYPDGKIYGTSAVKSVRFTKSEA